jgi:hypothetical protein
MRTTRLIELTLFYNLQDALSQSRTKEKPKSADFTTYNLKYINVQTKYSVTVYKNGTVVNPSQYKVDYINGMISFTAPNTSSDVIEVSYTYCPINIYDESMSPQSADFKFPAVSVYEFSREDRAFELGNPKKQMQPAWMIEVWAERGGERNDITDDVMAFFEQGSIPIIDYNIAFPTNSDGTKNTSYNESAQVVGYIYCDSINYRKGGSLNIGDQQRFLTEIIADLTINI